MSDQPFVMV